MSTTTIHLLSILISSCLLSCTSLKGELWLRKMNCFPCVNVDASPSHNVEARDFFPRTIPLIVVQERTIPSRGVRTGVSSVGRCWLGRNTGEPSGERERLFLDLDGCYVIQHRPCCKEDLCTLLCIFHFDFNKRKRQPRKRYLENI